MCDIMRRMCDYFFTLVGIFLKTMQLHGTIITEIFRLDAQFCGHFNLYWSLDAISALKCVLSVNTSDLVYRNESCSPVIHMDNGAERGLTPLWCVPGLLVHLGLCSLRWCYPSMFLHLFHRRSRPSSHTTKPRPGGCYGAPRFWLVPRC